MSLTSIFNSGGTF